mmetsp:Transcript_161412/g.518248  ORF Transcript_161412/g.518248 Transcript_161412/m.518248 type:complete len:221 (+) Transcript_161412:202-864(+)
MTLSRFGATVFVGQDRQVRALLHTEKIQALLHVEVLANLLVRQLVPTSRLLLAVCLNGKGGEDLEGAIEAEAQLAVYEVELLVSSRRKLFEREAEALRQEDSIWVDLHHPVLLQISTLLKDHVPSFQENLGIQDVLLDAILRLYVCLEHSGVDHHRRTRSKPNFQVAEDGPIIASKDANTSGKPSPQQIKFVCEGLHHRETEERRTLGKVQLGGCRRRQR